LAGSSEAKDPRDSHGTKSVVGIRRVKRDGTMRTNGWPLIVACLFLCPPSVLSEQDKIVAPTGQIIGGASTRIRLFPALGTLGISIDDRDL
jgi:hypothetical protein